MKAKDHIIGSPENSGLDSANSHRVPLGKETTKKRRYRSRSMSGTSSGGTSSKRAPFKSTDSETPANSKTISRFRSETSVTKTGQSPPKARGDLTCHKALLNVFQFLSIENPSVDDIMSLNCAREFGLATATFLAERFHWEQRRTAQAIQTIFFGRGRFDSIIKERQLST